MVNINKMSFFYRKKDSLFEDFSLELLPGNIYGLLGKNGAGKTTLLKLISGLLFPQSGECLIENQKTLERKPKVLQEIIFLPENSFLPAVTIKEYLEVYSPLYLRFDKEKFMRFLSELEIKFESKINSLSYGQKKKLSLAFSLAANTKVLLLDEPTNGLDIPAKTVFRKLVAESIDESKVFLISTHQVRDMKHLIDPILILDKGKILFHQTLQSIEEKISLNLQKEEPNGENVVYYESTLGGYVSLCKNTNGIENEIDIELLFNAVTANHEKINSLFYEEVPA